MILCLLVDYNDSGDFYRLTVETENPLRMFREFLGISHDVRYIESKSEKGKRDKGVRRMPDGSVILRSCFFGSKIGAMMRFENNAYKIGVIQKAMRLTEGNIVGLSSAVG